MTYTVESLRAGVHAAARDLLAHGPLTTRTLYDDDRVWAAVGAGYNDAAGQYWSDIWLMEVATPDAQPVRADTKWRLKESEQ